MNMNCRQCGAPIPNNYLTRDSFRCPECGKTYYKRTNSHRQQPQQNAARRSTKPVQRRKSEPIWKSILTRKVWKLPVWALLAIVIVLVGIIASSSSTPTPDKQAAATVQQTANQPETPTATEAPSTNGEYKTDKISFKIAGNYRYTESGNNYLVIQYDWSNISNENVTFIEALQTEVYQNGVQVDVGIIGGFDINTLTKVMPGYGATAYEVYEMPDNSQMTVIVDQFLDMYNAFDNVTYTVEPSSLQTFNP